MKRKELCINTLELCYIDKKRFAMHSMVYWNSSHHGADSLFRKW
jgi:hypothetical protein